MKLNIKHNDNPFSAQFIKIFAVWRREVGPHGFTAADTVVSLDGSC